MRPTGGETKISETPPIVSIVGASGSGKTTLLEKLIPQLGSRGVDVGTIKHDPHNFEVDRPGKDSWRHKNSGAKATILSSPYQIALVMDVDYDYPAEDLAPLLAGVDLILTEGYKQGKNPKVEVFRSSICDEPLCKGDPTLLALISDDAVDIGVPRFSPNQPSKLADFLVTALGIASAPMAGPPSG
jgi:molybdopterin-guanine dinucleotide biosynthesis protein B